MTPTGMPTLKDAADCIMLASLLRAPYVCLDLPFEDAADEDRAAELIDELLPLPNPRACPADRDERHLF
jgi:hypothetical protein